MILKIFIFPLQNLVLTSTIVELLTTMYLMLLDSLLLKSITVLIFLFFIISDTCISKFFVNFLFFPCFPFSFKQFKTSISSFLTNSKLFLFLQLKGIVKFYGGNILCKFLMNLPFLNITIHEFWDTVVKKIIIFFHVSYFLNFINNWLKLRIISLISTVITKVCIVH